LLRNRVVILSGKEGLRHYRLANLVRNRVVISRVKKGKSAQSYCIGQKQIIDRQKVRFTGSCNEPQCRTIRIGDE